MYNILNRFNFFSPKTYTPLHKYGWKKGDKYKLAIKKKYDIHPFLSTVKSVDLRDKCPPVYDQGQLGSCSANAIGFCLHYDELAQSETNPFIPSRLFIYYNERVIEGDPNTDSGAQIHDGISSISQTGVCPETMWPYDISKFTIKPSDDCYTDAQSHRAIEYNAVEQDLQQLRQVLLSGFPIVFGFAVYPSFESSQVASTGVVPMPGPDEQPIGGHAVALVGFDDTKKQFIVRNSWGDSWGDKGYFYMPYDYVLSADLAEDFWVVKSISVPKYDISRLEKIIENVEKTAKKLTDAELDKILKSEK